MIGIAIVHQAPELGQEGRYSAANGSMVPIRMHTATWTYTLLVVLLLVVVLLLGRLVLELHGFGR